MVSNTLSEMCVVCTLLVLTHCVHLAIEENQQIKCYFVLMTIPEQIKNVKHVDFSKKRTL